MSVFDLTQFLLPEYEDFLLFHRSGEEEAPPGDNTFPRWSNRLRVGE